ncbi:MAG: hypothetical protein WBX30_17780 [Stellaceae bacterium]
MPAIGDRSHARKPTPNPSDPACRFPDSAAGDDVLDHAVGENIPVRGRRSCFGTAAPRSTACRVPPALPASPRRFRRSARDRRAHRAGNVFDLLFAQILKREVKLIAHLVAHDPAHTDPAGLGQRLEAGGDVDLVAVNVALVDDNIAEINADAELDTPFSRDVSLALGHCALHFGSAAHRIDDAGKLDQCAVAGGFEGDRSAP